MKLLKFGGLVSIFLAIVILQSCGNTKTDTNGSLTISAPTITDLKCGNQTVTATITYTPPAGKVPNGVEVTVSEFENNVLMARKTATLTSSNSVIYTFLVTQSTTTPTAVVINASIGDMESSAFAFVPVITFSNLSGCTAQ